MGLCILLSAWVQGPEISTTALVKNQMSTVLKLRSPDLDSAPLSSVLFNDLPN